MLKYESYGGFLLGKKYRQVTRRLLQKERRAEKMGLIFKDILKTGARIYSDASSFYITVDAKYLSKQYQLIILSTIFADGKILGVSKITESLTQNEKIMFEKYLMGKEVRFRVGPALLVGYDSLYFDDPSWTILRDGGVFPNEYELTVKIEKIEILNPLTQKKQVMEVYPYSDVTVR